MIQDLRSEDVINWFRCPWWKIRVWLVVGPYWNDTLVPFDLKSNYVSYKQQYVACCLLPPKIRKLILFSLWTFHWLMSCRFIFSIAFFTAFPFIFSHFQSSYLSKCEIALVLSSLTAFRRNICEEKNSD